MKQYIDPCKLCYFNTLFNECHFGSSECEYRHASHTLLAYNRYVQMLKIKQTNSDMVKAGNIMDYVCDIILQNKLYITALQNGCVAIMNEDFVMIEYLQLPNADIIRCLCKGEENTFAMCLYTDGNKEQRIIKYAITPERKLKEIGSYHYESIGKIIKMVSLDKGSYLAATDLSEYILIKNIEGNLHLTEAKIKTLKPATALCYDENKLIIGDKDGCIYGYMYQDGMFTQLVTVSTDKTPIVDIKKLSETTYVILPYKGTIRRLTFDKHLSIAKTLIEVAYANCLSILGSPSRKGYVAVGTLNGRVCIHEITECSEDILTLYGDINPLFTHSSVIKKIFAKTTLGKEEIVVLGEEEQLHGIKERSAKYNVYDWA